MKLKHNLSLPALAITALVTTAARPSVAEPAELVVPNAVLEIAPAKETTRSAHYLRLHNVSARIMAWWIDPTHNPEPIEIAYSRKNVQPVKQAWNVVPEIPYGSPKHINPALSIQSPPKLPAGIDQIIGVDPQNTLLVYGTEEAVSQLKAIVAALDKPIPQVEIEARFVQVTPSALDALGIN